MALQTEKSNKIMFLRVRADKIPSPEVTESDTQFQAKNKKGKQPERTGYWQQSRN